MRHGVENEFDAAGDSHFVEDAEQILFDGVLAEPQLGCDSAIGQAIGDESDHLLFARRQQKPAVGVDDTQGGHLGERVQNIIHLLAVDPNLAAKNALNALAEHGKRGLGEKKNTLGAGAQALTTSSRSSVSTSNTEDILG